MMAMAATVGARRATVSGSRSRIKGAVTPTLLMLSATIWIVRPTANTPNCSGAISRAPITADSEAAES